jgi:hypothetical protein
MPWDTDTSVEMALASIAANLMTPNETDSNLEPANMVDGLFAIARALDRVASQIKGYTELVREQAEKYDT